MGAVTAVPAQTDYRELSALGYPQGGEEPPTFYPKPTGDRILYGELAGSFPEQVWPLILATQLLSNCGVGTR